MDLALILILPPQALSLNGLTLTIPKGASSMYIENGEYVTFDAKQIKSATDNSGAFDGGNDSILYQERFNAELQQATTKDSLVVENENASGVIDVASIRGVLGKELEFVGDSVAQEAYLQKMLPVIESTRAFGRELEKHKSGELRTNNLLNLGMTSEILISCGAERLPITMSQGVLEKISIGKHDLTYEQIKMLPIALNQPIMVFDSATDSTGNSLVILLELKDTNKNNIVVALGLNYTINDGQHLYEVNSIKSAYGKDNAKNKIAEWIHDGLLKYEHKKRSQHWKHDIGLQLPKSSSMRSKGTIHDESGFVKLETWEKIIKSAKNSKNHEIFYQRSRLFPKNMGLKDLLTIAEGELKEVNLYLDQNGHINNTQTYKSFMESETQGGVLGYIIQHGIKIPRPVKGSHAYKESMEGWNSLPEKCKENQLKDTKHGFERVMDRILWAMENEGLISSSTTIDDLTQALSSDYKMKKTMWAQMKHAEDTLSKTYTQKTRLERRIEGYKEAMFKEAQANTQRLPTTFLFDAYNDERGTIDFRMRDALGTVRSYYVLRDAVGGLVVSTYPRLDVDEKRIKELKIDMFKLASGRDLRIEKESLRIGGEKITKIPSLYFGSMGGAYRFNERTQQHMIYLTEYSNISTLIHEFNHAYLSELRYRISSNLATDYEKEIAQKIETWVTGELDNELLFWYKQFGGVGRNSALLNEVCFEFSEFLQGRPATRELASEFLEHAKTLDSEREKSQPFNQDMNRFSESLEQFINQKNNYKQLHILNTPPVFMKRFNIADKPIEMSRKNINKVMKKHNVSLSELSRLPEAIDNAYCVFKSKTQVGAITLLTDMKVADQVVMVAIDVNSTGASHEITSIYARENFEDYNRWIKEGMLIGVNKKRIQEILLLGLQLPSGAFSNSKNTIILFQEKANENGENTEESLKKRGKKSLYDEFLNLSMMEMFARANEKYIMEGHIISNALRIPLERIKQSMIDVYGHMNRLGVNMDPSITSVFDRMLATDNQIQNNHASIIDLLRASFPKNESELRLIEDSSSSMIEADIEFHTKGREAYIQERIDKRADDIAKRYDQQKRTKQIVYIKEQGGFIENELLFNGISEDVMHLLRDQGLLSEGFEGCY